MIREFVRVPNDCVGCNTIFKKGDLVFCQVDPLYLTESVFDCGKYIKDIGLVTEVVFYKQHLGQGVRSEIVCELEIHWANANKTSCHLDKYIAHLEESHELL